VVRQVSGNPVFRELRVQVFQRVRHYGRRTVSLSIGSPRLIRLSCRFRCFVGSHGLTLIVVIRLVIKLLFKHVLGPLLCNRLKRLQGIASSSVGREEAWVALPETLSTSPKKTLGAEYKATRQYEAIQAANIFRSEIQRSPLLGKTESANAKQAGADTSGRQSHG
jgi:hypothetical protein